jgi:hypothetical protein
MSNNRNDMERESDRILGRISRESDGGSSLFARTARRARDHVSARDMDGDDRIELLGTRIGRVLGLILLAGLIVYLVSVVAGG